MTNTDTRSFVEFEVVEPNHFSNIPNFIFEMGLSPFQFRVYAEYRCRANERGESWWSNKKWLKDAA